MNGVTAKQMSDRYKGKRVNCKTYDTDLKKIRTIMGIVMSCTDTCALVEDYRGRVHSTSFAGMQLMDESDWLQFNF